MRFEAGQVVFVKNVGYGLASYEEYRVEQVKDGLVKLESLDTWFDAETGMGAGDVYGLGFEVRLCVTHNDEIAAKRYMEDGCLR
jgi:hypothetical protein